MAAAVSSENMKTAQLRDRKQNQQKLKEGKEQWENSQAIEKAKSLLMTSPI